MKCPLKKAKEYKDNIKSDYRRIEELTEKEVLTANEKLQLKTAKKSYKLNTKKYNKNICYVSICKSQNKIKNTTLKKNKKPKCYGSNVTIDTEPCKSIKKFTSPILKRSIKQSKCDCFFEGVRYSHGISIISGMYSYYCNRGVWVKNTSVWDDSTLF